MTNTKAKVKKKKVKTTKANKSSKENLDSLNRSTAATRASHAHVTTRIAARQAAAQESKDLLNQTMKRKASKGNNMVRLKSANRGK